MPLVGPLLAADVPRWIWAALLMAAVVIVTVLTMWLVRYPVRRVPPARDADRSGPDDDR